jgi:hypothetical protein
VEAVFDDDSQTLVRKKTLGEQPPGIQSGGRLHRISFDI